MPVKLFVGGLSFTTSSEGLREAFARFGAVESAAVMTDRETGRSRGFGFVEMATTEEAERAITSLNGSTLDGRMIRVDKATPKGTAGPGGPRGPRPGGAYGGPRPGGSFGGRGPGGPGGGYGGGRPDRGTGGYGGGGGGYPSRGNFGGPGGGGGGGRGPGGSGFGPPMGLDKPGGGRRGKGRS